MKMKRKTKGIGRVGSFLEKQGMFVRALFLEVCRFHFGTSFLVKPPKPHRNRLFTLHASFECLFEVEIRAKRVGVKYNNIASVPCKESRKESYFDTGNAPSVCSDGCRAR